MLIYGLQSWIPIKHLSPLLIVSFIVIGSLYLGKIIKLFHLPSLIGFMFMGVFLGPSLLNIVDIQLQENLSFITEIALGFIAFSIGLELSMHSLRNLGWGIISIIFCESFGAFILVSSTIYLLTGELSLALIFGSMAPASAPAGTVAVIKEYKAKGSLTKALYAVVGFDDGLAIIIFGFTFAIVRSLINQKGADISTFLLPLKEIGLSFFIGIIIATIFCYLIKKIKVEEDIFILTFAFVCFINGLCVILHLSLILTNMIWGFIVINTQNRNIVQKIGKQLTFVMPLLFVMFFCLAGANLHISALPSLGVIGIVYFFSRSFGLIAGSYIGASIGRSEDKIKKYIGLGILSQAGVAIGLALIVKHEFQGLGKVLEVVNGVKITYGDWIGSSILNTVTATSIFFEILGPICTKIALSKAKEIELPS